MLGWLGSFLFLFLEDVRFVLADAVLVYLNLLYLNENKIYTVLIEQGKVGT